MQSDDCAISREEQQEAGSDQGSTGPQTLVIRGRGRLGHGRAIGQSRTAEPVQAVAPGIEMERLGQGLDCVQRTEGDLVGILAQQHQAQQQPLTVSPCTTPVGGKTPSSRSAV
ncbi:hypothetical protein O6P43_017278 [Quillaja saponaria]|uniref:Uncharacterized protein n=1 Tax=Quillaja saponaria TaxID=32244 RepID=A0AAD7PN68_QUISA|nr:hypothetical protein O6P43_017278 [Quillaja saponaria]